jgi:hypothetical protein
VLVLVGIGEVAFLDGIAKSAARACNARIVLYECEILLSFDCENDAHTFGAATSLERIGRPLESARNNYVSPHLRNLLASYSETLLAQVQQTVGCNALHTVEERMCRWLLMMHGKRSIFIDLPHPARIEDRLIQMPPVSN